MLGIILDFKATRTTRLDKQSKLVFQQKKKDKNVTIHSIMLGVLQKAKKGMENIMI